MEGMCLLKLKSKPTRLRGNEWTPPPAGLLKFNVDGSSHGTPGKSGVGGIIRNERRQRVGLFSMAAGDL